MDLERMLAESRQTYAANLERVRTEAEPARESGPRPRGSFWQKHTVNGQVVLPDPEPAEGPELPVIDPLTQTPAQMRELLRISQSAGSFGESHADPRGYAQAVREQHAAPEPEPYNRDHVRGTGSDFAGTDRQNDPRNRSAFSGRR
jgi:hypothetical protein